MRLILASALCALLCGCAPTKSTPPPAVVIEKVVKHYVPIEPKLRARCPWPKGSKPSESIEVARKRRECLEHYERQLDGIDAVQGGPVP